MQKQKLQIFSLWIIGILSIPLAIVPSQVMNHLTSILQPGAVDKGITVVPVVAMFCLSIIGLALLDVISTIIKGVALESKVRRKSLQLFDHVLKAKPEFFRSNQTAKISRRIVQEVRNTETFRLDMKVGMPLAVIALTMFGYAMFMGLDESTPVIGSYLPSGFNQEGNWFLGILILVSSPFQAYFLLFDSRIQRVKKASANAADEIADISHETVNGVQEIRNNYAFDYALSRLGHSFANLRRVEIDITKIRALFSGMGPVIDGLIKVLLLAVGARLCTGDIDLPFTGVTVAAIEWSDYMGFAGIAVVVNQYVGNVNDYLYRWRMSKESFRRVQEFESADQLIDDDTELEPIDGKNDPLTFDGVDVESNDGVTILKNLAFNVEPGEHIAFVGPSGCGKSTALNLIVRECDRSSGALSFFETPIERCRYESLSREVGFVAQKPVLLNTSIRNNVLLGLRRPSRAVIADDDGPVDVSGHPGCRNWADLDSILVETIEKVGLGPDLARKGLHNPAGRRHDGSPLFQRIDGIRQEIALRIEHASRDLVVPFERDRILPGKSVRENIVFGMVVGADLDNPHSNSDIDDITAPLLVERDVYDDLLWLGQRLFLHDQNIAAQIKSHSAALYEVLADYRGAGEDTEALSTSIHHVMTNRRGGLRRLKPELQRALVRIALRANMGRARMLHPESETFEERVLKAREEAAGDRRVANLGLVAFDGRPRTGGLTMRETLLEGQVNGEIRGASDDIDRMIVETLQGAGLLGELILMGLDAPVGENAANLSGGQAMKVAIARAILKNPSILLLDEATAALDEESQTKIVRMLEAEFRGRTVIMISHRLSAIRDFDRVIVFDKGKIVQNGSYDALVEQPGLFRDLVKSEQGQVSTSSEPAKDVSPSPAESPSETADVRRAIAMSSTFGSLEAAQVALLERMAQIVSVAEGETLFVRGDDGDELFVILDGRIAFFVESEDGEREVVDTYGPGCSFGELALFGGVPRTLGAFAQKWSRLCVVSRSDLLRLIEINPELSLNFLQNVSRQVATLRSAQYAPGAGMGRG